MFTHVLPILIISAVVLFWFVHGLSKIESIDDGLTIPPAPNAWLPHQTSIPFAERRTPVE